MSLTASLKQATGLASDLDLMNHLQDLGLVSDEAVTIADCAYVDLKRAYQLLVTASHQQHDTTE